MARTSNVVVCKEGAGEHVLSDNFPHNGLWIYCCNCQTFIAWEPGEPRISLRECPFCLSSLNPRMYACDNCAITMIDFDDQTLRKHHTVLSWGMPQPACPGCHQFPKSTPRVHFCQAMGCNLSTARDQCPYCHLGTEEMAESGAVKTRGLVGSTLAEAQARANEADEKRRSGDKPAVKEHEMRPASEKKASDIEMDGPREVRLQSAPSSNETDAARQEAERAIARAELEALARAEAEARAREAEARRLEAIQAAEHEAEMRAAAEVKAREMAGIYTSRLHQMQQERDDMAGKDKVSIALYAAIATFLLLALIMLIITMLRLYNA